MKARGVKDEVTASGLTDPDLVERVAVGDREAFLELYDRHVSRVFALAVRMLGDRASAEEVKREGWRDQGILSGCLATSPPQSLQFGAQSPAEPRRSSPDPADPRTKLPLLAKLFPYSSVTPRAVHTTALE